MAVVQVSARVDGKIRDAAERVFEQYGLDLSTAIRSMLTITANSKRLPFVIGMPPVSLDGDGFADDTAYFKQIPGYWEGIVKAAEEPAADGQLYDPESFWSEG